MRGISRRSALLAVVAVVLGAGSGAVVAPAAHATTTSIRYASPLGRGTSCSVRLPCSIVTAINDASGEGADVRIRPGSYGSAQHPLTTELSPPVTEVIDGMSVTSPPVIYEDSPNAGLLNNIGDQVTGIKIVYSGTGYGLAEQSSVSRRVSVVASSGSAACAGFGTMVSSLCVTTAPGAVALAAVVAGQGGSTLNLSTVLDGVTAVATGAGSGAIKVAATDGITMDVTATNTIAMGTEYGVEVVDLSGGQSLPTATMQASHSDLVNDATPSDGRLLTTDATDITAAPKFVAALHGDFQEAHGSPTVDGGAPEPAGSLDLAGNPRTIGQAPDMGAYELPLKPIFSAPPQIVSVRQRAARVGCQLWAVDTPTTFRLIAVHGKQIVRSKKLQAHNLKKPKTVTITIHGLTPHRTYFVHLVARNAGGTTTSKARRIRTKR